MIISRASSAILKWFSVEKNRYPDKTDKLMAKLTLIPLSSS